MRNLSAANLKQKRDPKNWAPSVEGSVIRIVWDLLQAHKGNPIDLTAVFVGNRHWNAIRITLVDIWGLDIAYQHKVWTLVGEWKGKDYHDYRTPRYRKQVIDAVNAAAAEPDGIQQETRQPDPAEVPFWGS